MSSSFNLHFGTRIDKRWKREVIRELNTRRLAPNKKTITLDQSFFPMPQLDDQSEKYESLTLINGEMEWGIGIGRPEGDDSIVYRRMVWYRSNEIKRMSTPPLACSESSGDLTQMPVIGGKRISGSAKTERSSLMVSVSYLGEGILTAKRSMSKKLTICEWSVCLLLRDLIWLIIRETQEIWRLLLDKCLWEVTNYPFEWSCRGWFTRFHAQYECERALFLSNAFTNQLELSTHSLGGIRQENSAIHTVFNNFTTRLWWPFECRQTSSGIFHMERIRDCRQSQVMPTIENAVYF
jgi:hypothetical protein